MDNNNSSKKKSHHVIGLQLPFFLNDSDDAETRKQKVLAVLGGESTFTKEAMRDYRRRLGASDGGNNDVSGSGGNYRVYFQPETPMSVVHAVGANEKSHGLALKVKRRRSNGEIVAADVLGKFDELVKFKKPSDFVYRPTEFFEGRKDHLEGNLPLPAISGLPQQILNVIKGYETKGRSNSDAQLARVRTGLFLPPHRFLTEDPKTKLLRQKFCGVQTSAQQQQLEQVAENEGEEDEEEHNNIKDMITITDLDMIPEAISDTVMQSDNPNWMLQAIHQAFAKRPVWTKEGLMWELAATTDKKCTDRMVNKHLPKVAYRVTMGPFRQTLVKRGYDPRKDTEASKFQTINYKLERNVYNSIREMNLKLKVFGINAQGTGTVQLCEIKDRLIRDLVQNNVLPEYDDTAGGWFPESIVGTIRHRISSTVSDMMAGVKGKDDCMNIPSTLTDGDCSDFEKEEWKINILSKEQVDELVPAPRGTNESERKKRKATALASSSSSSSSSNTVGPPKQKKPLHPPPPTPLSGYTILGGEDDEDEQKPQMSMKNISSHLSSDDDDDDKY